MQNELAIVSQEQMAISEVKRLVNIVIALKNEVFVSGVDFGIIPGTGDKPTLLQPGMEKLLKALHLRAEYVERSKIEDFDKPLIYYRYECRLYDWETGICVGTSIGSANSYESKWRWRWLQEHELPSDLEKALLPKRGGRTSEFEFAIDKAETSGKYAKSSEYWQAFKDAIANGTATAGLRETKNGKKPTWEIDTTVYRVPNADIMDQMNTIDKIAQKRSLGSAIKTVANVSMLYTVDVEDFTPYDTGNVVQGTYTVVKDEAPQIGQRSDSAEMPNGAPKQPVPAPHPTTHGAEPQNVQTGAPDPLEQLRQLNESDGRNSASGDFDDQFPPATTTNMPQIGNVNMIAVLNSALKEKLVKHRNHFINLVVRMRDKTHEINDTMNAEQVLEAIRQHEAAKDLNKEKAS